MQNLGLLGVGRDTVALITGMAYILQMTNMEARPSENEQHRLGWSE